MAEQADAPRSNRGAARRAGSNPASPTNDTNIKTHTEMETIKCRACGRELPLSEFRTTKWGGHYSTCNDCVKEKQAQTRYNNRHRNTEQPSVSDPDFDGRDIGDVWRQMCRAKKWLESRGCKITLVGEYREIKIRKLKPE